jgi:predicted Zn-dependent protease
MKEAIMTLANRTTELHLKRMKTKVELPDSANAQSKLLIFSYQNSALGSNPAVASINTQLHHITYKLILLLITLIMTMGLSYGHDSTAVAIARITSDLSKQPEEAILYLDRACLHLEHGDWKASLTDLDQAERYAKSDLGINRIRGKALVHGKQWKDAITALDTHLKSHPSDPSAWMELAHVHESMGEIAAAAEDCLHAIQQMPHAEPDAIIKCADLLKKTGRKDDALALLDRPPLRPVLVEFAIAIDLEEVRYDSALRRIDALIAITKVKEPLLAKRASILAHAGRKADSIAAWNSLSEQLGKLPNEARDSQAMVTLARQCQYALESLTQSADIP